MSTTGTGFTLWLEFEHWQEPIHDSPTDDFFNMQVTLADGRVYAFNVWTFDYVRRAQREALENGDRHLLAPDLLVERLDRALIEEAIEKLLAGDGLPEHCRVEGDDEG